MEIGDKPNWTDDPRAYGLRDGLTPSAEDIDFPSLDGVQNVPQDDIGDSDIAALISDELDESFWSRINGSKDQREETTDSKSGALTFPLSPPNAPVALDPSDIPTSPAPSTGDEDEFPDPSQLLTQLTRAMKPTPSKAKVHHDDNDSDDDGSSRETGLEDSPRVISEKSQGKRRATSCALAGPGPSTQPNLKRKFEILSSQPSPRPTQRFKSNDSSRLNSQATLNVPSSSPLDQLKYHFHDSFLYLDGSVIVRIGMTQFKLHRTLLAEHGVWFKERFEEDPDDMVRELPVYILDGVVEEPDFVNLLTAVKEAITYLERPPTFVVLVSILRAAHKLQFARFKNWVIGLLEKMWPAELEPLSQSSCTTRLSTRLSPDEATSVVSVARECGLGGVLKRALYELVRTDCFGQKSTSSASASTSSSFPDATLSPSDYHVLVQARERLVSSWISVAAASFPPCSDAITAPCVARGPVPDTTFFRLLHENPSSHLSNDNDAKMEVSRSLFETYTNDPLGGVEKLALLYWEGGPEGTGLGYCTPCAQVRKEFWVKRREEWWEIFGQVVGC